MASKSKNTKKSQGLTRQQRQARALSYIFLGISVILILSMILSSVVNSF
ncbi:MAG: hypothetical protein AB1846_02280 [Chloroflexota bacterium]